MNDEHLKLFVTSLPDDWDHDKIKEYFSAQATVLEVEVFKEQGRSKKNLDLGCAYVKFAKKREAEEVMKKLSKEVR